MDKNTSPERAIIDGNQSFLMYLEKNIHLSIKNGNDSAAEKIKCTLSRFKRFLEEKGFLSDGDFLFKMVTGKVMTMFEEKLKKDMLSLNTISFYMRILRSYYQKAISEGIVGDTSSPFKNVYTGVEKTKKRAVEQSVMHKIKNAELPVNLSFSKDLFLFSFYTRGMSFIDISFLKEENIRNGCLKYFRRKTGQEIKITLEPCMVDIILKYKGLSGRSYLFPIRYKNNVPLKYGSVLRRHNKNLFEISSITSVR